MSTKTSAPRASRTCIIDWTCSTDTSWISTCSRASTESFDFPALCWGCTYSSPKAARELSSGVHSLRSPLNVIYSPPNHRDRCHARLAAIRPPKRGIARSSPSRSPQSIAPRLRGQRLTPLHGHMPYRIPTPGSPVVARCFMGRRGCAPCAGQGLHARHGPHRRWLARAWAGSAPPGTPACSWR